MAKSAHPQRLGRSILACIAIGLLANVLFAWALAIFNLPEMLSEREIVVKQTDWPMPPPAGWPAYRHDAADEAMYGADVEFILCGASRLSGTMTVSGVTYGMNVRTAGFPMRSLALGECAQGSGDPHLWQRTRRYALGWLPLCPLWPGFALNTLFYAAIAWGLWQVPLAIRRRRRRRMNTCIKCGYDRAGLVDGAACPECGAKS
jgi:hypothetical protein